MPDLRLSKTLWLVAAMALLFGCTQTPRQLDVDEQLQDTLRRAETWQAEGKLGVRVGSDAHSANFDWQHQPDTFSLRLSGPFGQGTTWLRKQGQVISLEGADQPLRHASSAEQLMQEELGWHVPISNLRYWIKGIPAPRQPVSQLTHHPDGTLAELQQQGWHISYSRYGMHDGWALPEKLVATRDDIRLTLIIKSWAIQEPDSQAF